MPLPRRTVALVAVAASLGACVFGGDDGGDELASAPLRPTFPPETTPPIGAPGSETTAAATPGTTTAGDPATSTTAVSGVTPTTAPVGVLEGRITDPARDATVSLDPPPRWAELTAARLVRRGTGFELRVRLGADAPTRIDPDHTANVASFYDIDGDGQVDYEVWANLAAGGWGGAWFNNVDRVSAYGDDSRVDVAVEGGTLVLRFPLAHVASAQGFRWAMATEWGRYELLGSPATSRDSMPDGGRPARFPA